MESEQLRDEFRAVVKAAFSQRRKTLRNAWRSLPLDRFLSREDCGAILSGRNGRKPYDFETQARRADGEQFWTLISTIPFVFDWQPATLTCFHDITTRRLAEAALKEELDRKRAELDEARTLQLQLAPPPFRGHVGKFDVSLDVLLDPAKEVGGDLVDHFELTENLRVLVLGDVSNKGAGAAQRHHVPLAVGDDHQPRPPAQGEAAGAALRHILEDGVGRVDPLDAA